VLGIRRSRTTSYHPTSNGMLERWHKDLHTALSHYINAANTNWDTIAPFFYGAKGSATFGYWVQSVLPIAGARDATARQR